MKPRFRWVAPPGRRHTLSQVLGELGAPATLLAQGSVFVNGRRTLEAAEQLRESDVVEVFEPGNVPEKCHIVDRRGALLVVYKPAALASEPTQLGLDSATGQLNDLLGAKVHLASRLDVGVSGLMLASLSQEGNAHIADLHDRGLLWKQYVAFAAGRLEPDAGRFCSVLDQRGRRVAAETEYRVLESIPAPQAPGFLSALSLRPLTGRTHQLRIQCANAGAPLLGDQRHARLRRLVLGDGSVLAFERIMLHSAELALEDMRGHKWRITAELPNELVDLWRRLGGNPALLAGASKPAASSSLNFPSDLG